MVRFTLVPLYTEPNKRYSPQLFYTNGQSSGLLPFTNDLFCSEEEAVSAVKQFIDKETENDTLMEGCIGYSILKVTLT